MFPRSHLESSVELPDRSRPTSIFLLSMRRNTPSIDLIVLFYHLDRTLFPKIVHALNPSALFICKMAVQWSSETALDKTKFTPLSRNELPSLVPGLWAVSHHERPVKDRGVVEFVGRKSD